MTTRPAVLVVLASCAFGCATEGPDAEVRALLAAAEEAAEGRDGGFFADLIGASYRDARGNDRDQIVRMLRGYLLANQRIEVVSYVDEVVIEGATAARATVHAGLVGQRNGAPLLTTGAELYRFDLELVNDDGDWRIIGARWQPALGE